MFTNETQCTGCEQLRRENAILRQQIASNRWLALLTVGWMSLTILPIVAALAPFNTDGWIEFVGYGVRIGIPWTQCSILFCVLVLLDVRQSQKLLIFVIASAGLVACWHSIRNLDREMFHFAIVSPFISSLVALPAIFARIVFRLQITYGTSQNQRGPASIATYLVLTFVVAAMTSTISWLPQEIRDEFLNLRFLLVFGGPIVASMIITIPIILYFLNRLPFYRMPGIYSLGIWELVSVSISVAALSWVGLLEEPTAIMEYAMLGAIFMLVFSFVFSVAILWLRLLGFRLPPYVRIEQSYIAFKSFSETNQIG